MMNEKVVVQYKGFFDYSLLNKLLMDLINYVDKNEVDNYFLKKIQIVMVEMLENNYEYTHKIEKDIKKQILEPEFKLLRTGDGFRIIASNPMLINDSQKLKAHLDKINGLNSLELKELYKDTLKGGMQMKGRNSGTGLIRIRKVARNKINYSFKKIDNKLLYYTIEIMVNPK